MEKIKKTFITLNGIEKGPRTFLYLGCSIAIFIQFYLLIASINGMYDAAYESYNTLNAISNTSRSIFVGSIIYGLLVDCISKRLKASRR